MNMTNYDRVELKRRAKRSLAGVRPRTWVVTLLFVALASLLPAVIRWCLPDMTRDTVLAMGYDMMADPEWFAMQWENLGFEEIWSWYKEMCTPGLGLAFVTWLISAILTLVTTLLSYGYVFYTYKLYRGEKTAVNDLWSGFRVAWKAVASAVLVSVFILLWTIPVMILWGCALLILSVVMALAEVTYVAAAVVLILIGVVSVIGLVIYMVVIGYRYSLTPYFIMTQDRGIVDSIRAGKNAMRGNIGRRFTLDLSFLGWKLLNIEIGSIAGSAAVFVTMFGMIFGAAMSGGGIEYVDTAAIADLWAGSLIVSGVVGTLARLPLSLWLTPYEMSARAGFFLAVTGQDDGAVSPPGSDYVPPRPKDIWDQVPQPPSFTSPGGLPPIPPAPPRPPRPPVIEIPTWVPPSAGPNDPIPDVPAAGPEEKAAPVEAAEPETPAATEEGPSAVSQEPTVEEEPPAPATEEEDL